MKKLAFAALLAAASAFAHAAGEAITVYKDPHHLSATYVRSLTDELGRQMAAQLPWAGPEVP